MSDRYARALHAEIEREVLEIYPSNSFRDFDSLSDFLKGQLERRSSAVIDAYKADQDKKVERLLDAAGALVRATRSDPDMSGRERPLMVSPVRLRALAEALDEFYREA